VKFVDSPYYSEPELCGGAVTVSISKYLPWQAMNFMQLSTQFSKTCCRPLITSKFHASELPFHGWKSPEIAWRRDLDCMADVLFGVPPIHFFHAEPRIQFRSRLMRFLGFPEARNFEVINGLQQHVFEKWVERCKKCITCQGRYFEKETVTAPPQRSDSE
jgi:hypothetical protein